MAMVLLVAFLVLLGLAGLAHAQNKNCIAPDGNGGNGTVDFNILTQTRSNYIAYDPSSNKTTIFQLNVCAPLVAGTSCASTASACLTNLDGTNGVALATAGNEKIRVEGNGLYTMNFQAASGFGNCASPSVSVQFVCNQKGGRGSPAFLAVDSKCTYIFIWRTAYACAKAPISDVLCLFTDPATGNQYDLTPLQKTTSNYIAYDYQSTYRYHLNLCGPLQNVSTLPPACLGVEGNMICQETLGNSSVSLLGWSSSPVMDDSSLNVFTHFGSNCSLNIAKSASINFACDNTAGIGFPRFRESDPEECNYVFDWPSAAACPIQDTTGVECRVRDPVSGVVYDLSSTPATSVTYNNVTYTVGLCAPVQCGSASITAGVCRQAQVGTFMALADSPGVLDLSDGNLVMTFPPHSSTCTQPATAYVSVVCSQDNSTSLNYISGEKTGDSRCSGMWYFTLSTPAACVPPQSEVDCTYMSSNGTLFDLSSLHNAGNWVALGNDPSQSVVINVCGSLLLHSNTRACPLDQGACLIKSDNTTTGLGLPSSPAMDANGNLYLLYSNPSNPSGPKMKIIFICRISRSDGSPVFVNIDSNGTYVYTWATPRACGGQLAVGSQCQVTDPITGVTYDLRSLAKEYTYQFQNHTFHFSFCNLGFFCGTGVVPASLCYQYSGNSSILTVAYATDTLLYRDGAVFMNLNGTVPCLGNSTGMVAGTINFECDPTKTGADGPTPIGWQDAATSCMYMFTWKTALVCKNSFEVNCAVADPSRGLLYDLSPLTRYYGSNWVTTDGRSFSYEINVCRSIVPPTNSSCPPTAAICQRGGDVANPDRSLGLPASPYLNSLTGEVHMFFDGGRICTGGFYNRRTLIAFRCGQEIGSPVFIRQDSTCMFYFEWVTSAACPIVPNAGSDCTVSDPVVGYTYNLTSWQDRVFNVTSYGVGKRPFYQVTACGKVLCGNSTYAAACDATNSSNPLSIGNAFNNDLTLVNGFATLRYANGSKCANGQNSTTTIRFVCDRSNSGTTGPTLSSASNNCDYVFTWNTNLTCPPIRTSVPCQVVDPKTFNQYDLSPLINNRKDWLVYSPSGSKYNYDINVCRPLVSTRCTAGSAVCQNEVSVLKAYGLGILASGPQLDDNGTLFIDYVRGDACANSTRSTRVYFFCPRNPAGEPIPGVLGTPVFISEPNTCQYLIHWTTSYACPLQSIQGNNCTVTDFATGNLYDLTFLMRNPKDPITPDYAVANTSFHINVCLPAVTGCTGNNQGSCRPGNVTTKSDLGTANMNPTFYDGYLTLVYANSNNNCSTTIRFLCNPDVQVGNPVLDVAIDGSCTYIFLWETKYACPPTVEAECLAIDPTTNTVYDLSPLTNPLANYVVKDPRYQNAANNVTFQLNVCRSVVKTEGFPGCSGNGACQVSTSPGNYVETALGQVASPAVTNGMIVLDYAGGDVCTTKGNFRSSIRIVFICGPDLGYPSFVSETNTCQYIFRWPTSLACSGNGSLPVINSTCVVSDPLTGNSYDLSPLALSDTQLFYSAYPSTGFTYNLHVCGTALGCIDPSGVNSTVSNTTGACEVTRNSVNSLGNFPSYPTVVDGKLVMTYTNGDVCNGTTGARRSLTVQFVCSKTASSPRITQALSNCSYFAIWNTPYACPTLKNDISCSVRNPNTGGLYDLSALTRFNGVNWLAFNGQDKRYDFQINVCRSLLTPVPFNPEFRPCLNAGGCQVNRNVSNFFMPIGYLMSAPYFDQNGVLKLTYGAPDSANAPFCFGSIRRSMDISFTCQTNTLGQPQFIAEDTTCHYQFSWATSAACPLDSYVGSNCKVTNPTTGASYDFSKLTESYSFSGSSGIQYQLAFCNSLGNDALPGCEGAAACAGSGSGGTPRGAPNSQVTMEQGVLGLVYSFPDPTTPGSNCSTNIVFQCDNTLTGDPMFSVLSEDKCSLVVQASTAYACTTTSEIQCSYADSNLKEYDLTALKNLTSNYNVKPTGDNSSSFALNVCKSLNPQAPFTSCADGSGVCFYNATSNAFINYGSPQSIDMVNGNLVVSYGGGDAVTTCTNGNRLKSSQITFICGQNNGSNPNGSPVLVSVDDCSASFKWVTPLACAITIANGTGCKVVDPFTNRTIDISALSQTKSISGPGNNGQYRLNPCGTLSPPCGASSTAGICYEGSNPVSLGEASTQILYNTNSQQVSMTLSGGSPCKLGSADKVRSTIRFKCDPCASADSSPVFVSQYQNCVYLFDWFTPLSCPANAPCVPTSSTTTTTRKTTTTVGPTAAPGTKKSSKKGAMVAAIVIVLLVVIVAIVLLYLNRHKVFRSRVPYSAQVNLNNDDDDDDEPIVTFSK